MLHICEEFGNEYSVKYNSKKKLYVLNLVECQTIENRNQRCRSIVKRCLGQSVLKT